MLAGIELLQIFTFLFARSSQSEFGSIAPRKIIGFDFSASSEGAGFGLLGKRCVLVGGGVAGMLAGTWRLRAVGRAGVLAGARR